MKNSRKFVIALLITVACLILILSLAAGSSAAGPAAPQFSLESATVVLKDLDSTASVQTKLYVPFVLKNLSAQTGPMPGYWASNTGDEFYVTPDKAYVKNFAISFYVSGCGSFKITHIYPDPPITSNQFSYNGGVGGMYFSGTFDSATNAHGTDGLNQIVVGSCGTVTGGPWSYNATWQNSSQPSVSSNGMVSPDTVEKRAASGDFHTATIDK